MKKNLVRIAFLGILSGLVLVSWTIAQRVQIPTTALISTVVDEAESPG